MKYTLSEIFSAKFNLLHLIKIVFIQLGIDFVILSIYPFISMLAFGEGANSFMYSRNNNAIYIGSLIFIPTCINLIKFIRYQEVNNLTKAKNYLIAQIIVAVIFISIIVFARPGL